MRRDVFNIKALKCKFCGAIATFFAYDEKGRHMFSCGKCKPYIMYELSNHVCYYCGAKFKTKMNPLYIRGKPTCPVCFRQIQSGRNIRVDDGPKKILCLRGNIR